MEPTPILPAWLVGDMISAGAIVGSLLGLLPGIAALIALLWYAIQIWESSTVQHYLRNKRMLHKARKIAKLRAKEKVIVAQLQALESVRAAKAEARELVAAATAEAATDVIHEATKAQAKLPLV